ncbi:unnamed protein product [Peronospora destructor]|uniref:MAPEG family protein n=1 Tax=Peronospora destructor TaxID=86335 RepID=A0AAV0U4N6_9STRA|nr:unnamed protein product [Peronospora destructor]
MSVSAVRVTLQPAHDYVPLVVIGTGLVGVWPGFKAAAVRKQYSVPDPQNNVIENLPLFYATIYRPKIAAIADVVRVVGFIMYVKGTNDPKKRRHETFGYLGMLVMLGLSLETSLRILGYI